jgi:cytochrome c1
MQTRLRFLLPTFVAVAHVATGCSRYSDFVAEPQMATIRRVATWPRVRLTFANRIYLAGQLPNNPANLVHWIQRPHDIHPDTVMPNMDFPGQDAHNIAAYLYTLR